MDNKLDARDISGTAPSPNAPAVVNSNASSKPDISVGLVLAPQFTLLAFAGLVEALRHAADEADRSRQTYCQWRVIDSGNVPIQASCGIEINPAESLGDPIRFDYIAVIGGLLSAFPQHRPETFDFLRTAHAKSVPVIGLCTGVFAMAHVGLLDGRKCAVHWRHEQEMRDLFPLVSVITGEPYVIDDTLITCPGGVASIPLAAALIRKHCGPARALKSLAQTSVNPEHIRISPLPDLFAEVSRCGDRRVERAMELMRDSMSKPCVIGELASRLGTSDRQLHRAFQRHARMSPVEFWRRMRLEQARYRLTNSNRSITQIALECGFADAAHLARLFKAAYGQTPRAHRTARLIVSET